MCHEEFQKQSRVYGFLVAPCCRGPAGDDSFRQSLGLLLSLHDGSVGLALFFSVLMG